ncbi:hypothetical protein Ccrd_025621, partial [Cynara cardunculus var. scolymus]
MKYPRRKKQQALAQPAMLFSQRFETASCAVMGFDSNYVLTAKNNNNKSQIATQIVANSSCYTDSNQTAVMFRCASSAVYFDSSLTIPQVLTGLELKSKAEAILWVTVSLYIVTVSSQK